MTYKQKQELFKSFIIFFLMYNDLHDRPGSNTDASPDFFTSKIITNRLTQYPTIQEN